MTDWWLWLWLDNATGVRQMAHSLPFPLSFMSSKRHSLGLHFLSKKKKQEISELFDGFKNQDGKVPRTKIEEIMQHVGLDPQQTVPVSHGSVSTFLLTTHQ